MDNKKAVRRFKTGDRVRRASDGASGAVTSTEFQRTDGSTAPFWVRVKWDASNSSSDREEDGLVLAPSDEMNAREFAGIRHRLGLGQAELAPLLNLASAQSVSTYERATNPRPIPKHIARIMTAMQAGWRPSDWPK